MNSPDDRLYAAIAMAKAGQKQQAREIVAELLKRDRDNASAWLVMAQLVDDRREVIQCLKEVLRIEPGNARAAAYLKRLDPSVKAAARSASAQAARVRQSQSRQRSSLPIVVSLGAIVLLCGVSGVAAVKLGMIPVPEGFLTVLGTAETPVAEVSNTPMIVMTETASSTPTASPTPTATFTPSNTPTPTNTVTPRPSTTPRPTRTVRPTSTPAPTNSTSTPTLAPSVTLPTSAAGATQAISGMVITYDTQYYSFEASTEAEIREAIQTMGPDVREGNHAIASTEYSFRLSWREVQQGATCVLDNPTIQLDIVYTYPEWIPVGNPNSVLFEQWDEFIAYVTEHEERHAELAIDCGRDLLEAMRTIAPASSCVSLNTTINQIYDNELKTCSEKQTAFDQTEGFTTFPLP